MSTATFKVLASSVPWTPLVKGKGEGSPDTWDGYPREREARGKGVSECGEQSPLSGGEVDESDA